VNDIVVLPDDSLAVATDLGVLWRQAGQTQWTRLGSGLPTTTVMDLSVGPDGNLYVGTHGRGIWRIALPEGSLTSPTADASAQTDSTQGGDQTKGGGGKGHAKPPSSRK
jgi:ligand-binding sensor domain-containing protein